MLLSEYNVHIKKKKTTILNDNNISHFDVKYSIVKQKPVFHNFLQNTLLQRIMNFENCPHITYNTLRHYLLI